MLCVIYKSNIKSSTYLYVKTKDDFTSLPKALLKTFGPPVFVMVLDLSKRQRLAMANIERVRESLDAQGYYLQLPPPLDETLSYIRGQNNKII